MKYTITLSLLALWLPFHSPVLAQASLRVSPEDCTLIWTGRKVTGEHTGGLTISSGNLRMDGGRLSGAEIVVDMRSITCTDVSNPSSNAKLVAHLNSPDFFDTEKFPEALFRTTSVDPIPGAGAGKPNHRITGDLTIKGITHPITFDALVFESEGSTRAAANLTFDRAKYDVRYRSGSFFEGLGDRLIEDNVDLTFDLRAKP